MAVSRDRPYSSFNFLVDLGDGDPHSQEAGFEEVILPELGTESSTNLILKRGVFGSLKLYKWWNEARKDRGKRSSRRPGASRTVAVHLLDETGSVVLTWKFLRARPVKLRFSNLEADKTNVMLEYLELAFERLEME
jgi:phage tail-like protein